MGGTDNDTVILERSGGIEPLASKRRRRTLDGITLSGGHCLTDLRPVAMILYLGQIRSLTVGQDIAAGVEDSNPDAVIQKPCLISCQCCRIRQDQIPDIFIADLESGIKNIYTILLLPLILEEDENIAKDTKS